MLNNFMLANNDSFGGFTVNIKRINSVQYFQTIQRHQY